MLPGWVNFRKEKKIWKQPFFPASLSIFALEAFGGLSSQTKFRIFVVLIGQRMMGPVPPGVLVTETDLMASCRFS